MTAPEEPATEGHEGVPRGEPMHTVLDIYRLAVEMADRLSARRALANTFFLTANTGLVALLGGSDDLRWYGPAAGVVFTAAWWALLKSYRDLNRAKFEVIVALENRLPIRIYAEEWRRLHSDPVRFSLRPSGQRAWLAQYWELGRIERIVPCLFAVIFVAELLRQIVQ